MRNIRTTSHRKITTYRLSPESDAYRQQLELTNDLLVQGYWGKRTRWAQRASFNTLDNWGHKTPTQSKRKKERNEKVKGS